MHIDTCVPPRPPTRSSAPVTDPALSDRGAPAAATAPGGAALTGDPAGFDAASVRGVGGDPAAAIGKPGWLSYYYR